jgi:hypothetical protein
MVSIDVDSLTSMFMASRPCWLSPVSLQLPSWTNWLPTAKFSTWLDSTALHCTNWTELGQLSDIASEWTQREPRENTASNISSVVASRSYRTDHVAALLPTALLLLRDITVNVTFSSVLCAVIVTLISSLLCCNLVMALYSFVSQYCNLYYVFILLFLL